MKASRPTNLTTYLQLSLSLPSACPSPHTTMAQLLYTSSTVRWTCLEVWKHAELTDCIGEVHFTDDSKPDEVTKLVAGDVLHVDQGTHNTLTTPSKAKGKNKTI